LIIIILGARFLINNSYRNQIPKLPETASFSALVKEQLSLAYQAAWDSPTTENIGKLGMAFHSSANYDQANQCYKLAIKKDPSEWIWSYYLGYLYLEMGDSKSAIENLNFVLQENPKVYHAYYYLGKAYLGLTDAAQAESAFNKIAYLKENLSNARTIRVNYSSLPISARFELARMYLNSKRLDEAEKLLTEIVQRNHTIGPVYRLLGNVYSAKGDSVLSRKYLVRAQDLAEVTTLNDTLADRLTLLSRSEQYLPKQIDDALKSANPEWALLLLKQALQYLPDDKYLNSKAVKYFLRMDIGDNALPYLEKNFNNFRENFNEMSEVGALLVQKGFYSQAIKFLKQSNHLKPEFIDFHESLALCYWKTEKKDTALFLMNDFYEKNKSNAKVLAYQVDFMLKIQEKEKAKTFLTKLKQIAPSDPKTVKVSAIFEENEGNKTAATQSFEKAFSGDPDDLETTQKLITLLLEEKNWSKATSILKSALKKHPNEPFLLERLGTLMVACPDPNERNIEEGLEFSERAFYHISSSSEILVSAGKNLAQGYAMKGNFKLASYYMQITLNMAQNNHVPQDYMDGLLKLAGKIKHFSEKS
jgi:tetratricopeptide (TPR) repeat protein